MIDVIANFSLDANNWVKENSLLSNYELYLLCPNGQWLIYLGNYLKINMEILKPIACASARLSLKFIPQDDLRALKCIAMVEALACGEASIEDLKKAKQGAWDAYMMFLGNGKDAAACACVAAYYAASDGNSLGAVSYAQHASDSAKQDLGKEIADLVRSYLTFEMLKRANNKIYLEKQRLIK